MKLKRLPRWPLEDPEPIYIRNDPPIEEMRLAIASALAGQDWFDCWASIDEAARVAIDAILAVAIPESKS